MIPRLLIELSKVRLFMQIGLVLAVGLFGGYEIGAQTYSAYSKGTPAESKVGQAASYAVDKVENVSLTNGNLSVNLPLATVAGRGSAAYTISLSYNSKLWSGEDQNEVYDAGKGLHNNRLHSGVKFFEGFPYDSSTLMLGSGWMIGVAPAVRSRKVLTRPYLSSQCSQPDESGSCGYKYIMTKLSITLPDGSQVEMRDAATNGAPALTPMGATGGQPTDRDRGRVWQSTDGSAITFVTDSANGVVAGLLSGWVFLSDGSRLRIDSDGSSGIYGRCSRIEDNQGNYITIAYETSGAITYTDQMGRQTILQGMTGGATVTVKGYNGVPDRVIQIDTGIVAPADPNITPVNLRSDYQSLQRPFIGGDINTYQGGVHANSAPHTDLFTGADSWVSGGINMGTVKTVTRLGLLDGREFRFRYNPFGELAEVVYPAGGISQIDYQANGSEVCEGGSQIRTQLDRRVKERRLIRNGSSVDAAWRYTWGIETVDGVGRPKATVEARTGADPNGALLLSEKHFFLAVDGEYRFCTTSRGSDGTGYEMWENNREFRTEKQTGTGTQVTKRTFQQKSAVSWTAPDPGLGYNAYVAEHGQEQPPNDVRMTQEDVILENGKMKRTTFSHDAFNNVTSISEYDFGTSPNPGSLLRTTTRTYLTNLNGYCYTSINGTDGNCSSGTIASDTNSIIHQRRLMLSERVSNGNGAQKSYTELEYDNYLTDANHASIVSNSGMIQHNGSRFFSFITSGQPRGNATRMSAWTGIGANVLSYSQYDNAGNIVKTIDPRGYASTISYVDNFGNGSNPESGAGGSFGPAFAFPTDVTNPLGWHSKTQYNFALGAATGVKDPNGAIARVEFDSLGRAFRTTAPNGAVSETTFPTAFNNTSTSSSQIDSINWAASKTEYDTFGRVTKSWQNEDGRHASQASFTIAVQSNIDSLGRTSSVSNPYRPATESPIFSSTSFDLGGRVTSVTTPDGATATTSYNSEWTMVTDQAQKKRISKINGLGQLAEVWEVTPQDQYTEAVPGYSGLYGYKTAYTYDAVNNLTNVAQGTQTPRTFSYDGLSRLSGAYNPESGNISYLYDNSGNLTSKTDARSITTSYIYDNLNRVTQRSYTDATPMVTYTYDNLLNSKGRLTKVASGVSTTEYTGFDILGRVTGSKQTTDGVTYGNGTTDSLMTYTYNLSGSLIEQQYPSGRVVKTNLDADGDLSSVETKKNAGAGFSNYASNFSYNAAKAVTGLKLGNNLWESMQFNSRLQPTQIALGTTQNGTDKLLLNYGYGSNQNNGNVMSQTIMVPGLSTPFVQNYTYDELNRIKTATETNNGAQTWTQVYGFDRYGNRNITSGLGVTNFSFSGNRITAHTYDNAGNTIADGTGKTFTYDAENKQKTAVVNGYVNEYYYDGDGKRVKKYVPSTGETTIFVYDAFGKSIAEYSTIVETPATAKIAYLTNDHLGSPRINTDATGAVTSRHDYHPYGEEISTPQRAGQGYTDDTVRKQFTGYERDNESGLDFAQARMFGSSLGRFTAVDPLSASASPSNPQTFNRYTYVLNNPMVMTDPTGLIGDYYYDDGRYIGNDGKNDGKYYTATVDKRDITPEGEMIYVSNVKERPTAETMGIRALSGSLGATADAAIFGKLKGAANFLINNTTAGLLGIIPNVEYANQAEASHGTATQVGLGLGTVAAGSVFSAGASAVSVVPKAPPPSYPPGSFSIVDWSGYPAGPRPTGPFRLIEGAEYDTARSLANAANKQLHANNPGLKGLQIHEIHPVKFGGNPTAGSNKTFLDPAIHRQQYSPWWNKLKRDLQK